MHYDFIMNYNQSMSIMQIFIEEFCRKCLLGVGRVIVIGFLTNKSYAKSSLRVEWCLRINM